MKITFVIGAAGSGKTSFIRNKYPKSEKLAVFDLAEKSWELFQDYQALEDDRSVEVYNKCSQEGFFAMMDGKDLVVEYCADGHDDELFAVINQAKKAGIRTEVIFLTVDADVAWERIQKADSAYFSSSQIKEDKLEVLSGVIEDYVFNQDFEKICEVGSDGGSVSFLGVKYKEGKFSSSPPMSRPYLILHRILNLRKCPE
jgi:predicted kinase